LINLLELLRRRESTCPGRRWSRGGAPGLSVAKKFAITEGVRLEIRLQSYNALNGMNWVVPQLDQTKSDFGKTNTPVRGYYGRQFEYSARIEF
jgi:hypothetical protein